jgi:recombination protein RecR
MRQGPNWGSTNPVAAVARLIDEFRKLPGIGQKSAQRLTYYLVRVPPSEAKNLAESILSIKEQVSLCSICVNITDQDPCSICCNQNRDQTQLCIVEDPLDVLALERTLSFSGLYHVLHGSISPTNGIGPQELKIQELLTRLSPYEKPKRDNLVEVDTGSQGKQIIEIILATNPTLEGEATAIYLHHLLSPMGFRITRIARGLPTGAELEYADDATLINAFQGRQEL